MNNITKYFMVVLILGVLSSCTEKEKSTKAEHVIVIGIDGMSVNGVLKANTPTFDEILANGTYTLQARNIFQTVSSPNWNCMLTSATASMTGVSSNDWRHDKFNLPPMRVNENGWFPDIFYVLKKEKPELKTAAVYHWSGFGNLFDPAFVDINIDSKDEETTALDAIKVIKEEKPNFLFIQLDDVDHWGHTAGHMTPTYLSAVSKADSLAGEIINALKEEGLFESSLVIVNADHGGVGFDHGHETLQGNTVPYLFYGGAVKKGYKIPVSVTHFNLAPLSANALGVSIPEVWLGNNLDIIFNGTTEEQYDIVGAFNSPITNIPKILPRSVDGHSGGLFINKPARVEIELPQTNGDVFYTTDGTIPNLTANKYETPFELNHSCQVKAVFIGEDGVASPVAQGYFRVASNDKAKQTINYTIYTGEEWSKLPNFAKATVVESGKVFEFSTKELEDKIHSNTGVIFEGRFIADTAGEYTFFTRSDDGSKLYADNQEIVDNDGDHGVQERTGKINLEKGVHEIKVNYFNGGGGFFLEVLVEGPNLHKQILSPEYLTE